MSDLEHAVIEEIARIVTTELELALSGPVQPEQQLVSDLQLDSLGLTVLAVGLEDKFRVSLSGGDALGVTTVLELAELVSRRVADAGRGPITEPSHREEGAR